MIEYLRFFMIYINIEDNSSNLRCKRKKNIMHYIIYNISLEWALYSLMR